MDLGAASAVSDDPVHAVAVSEQSSGARAARTPLAIIRKVFGFGMMSVLSLVSTVAVLPSISHRFGEDGWTAVAFGASVGAAVAAVASLHWPIEGANEVAAYPAHRAAIQRLALRQRLIALAALTPLTVAITVWFCPGDKVVGTLIAVASSTQCFSQAWFFTGLGDPGRLVSFEGLPRLAANLLTIVALLVTPYLWLYPLLLAAASLVSLNLSLRYIRRLPGQVAELPRITRRQDLALATSSQVVNAVYLYLFGPLVAVVAPGLYAVFAAADRIGKILLNGLSAVPAAFQSWVGGGAPEWRTQRARQASLLFLVMSVIAGVLTGAVLPLIGDYLFAGTVDLRPVAWAGGGVVGAAFLSASLILVGLVPLGRARLTYWLLIIGAIVVAPMSIAGALLGGVDGLFLTWFAGLVVLVGIKLAVIFGHPRRGRHHR